MKKRDKFSTTIGFILSAAGAAIGLGNLWMFPWRLGQYGGAAFLLPYLFFVYILGTTGLMGEFGLGRWGQKGAIGAYGKVLREKGKNFGRFIGAYPVTVTWGILLFYAIVTGWILNYVIASFSGAFYESGEVGAYFGQLAGQPSSIIWQTLALLSALGIVIFGIAGGIERANKVIMPILIGLFVLLVIRSVTLPGAMAGIEYILVPDWSYLLQPITWGMALGQAFFTVSLSGAGMVVFGSYLKDSTDIPASALKMVTLDTAAALLAALIIMPAVFAYGLDPAAGPPLLFITMPEIFRSMPLGELFRVLFFISIFLAAISSLISMMEVVVEGVMDQFKWARAKSVTIVALTSLVCGLPLAVDMNRFTAFVDLITIYLAPAGATLAAIFFFWIFGVDNARKEINRGAEKPVGLWWNPVAKYFFVGVAIMIVILQIAYGVG